MNMNIHSDDDYESDYLEDSEDESCENNQKLSFPPDLVYEQFIKKVQNNDSTADGSLGSLDVYDDEDDEEEYNPDQVDSDYDDEDDDEIEDRLQKRELKALLQDCFLEIAGDKPEPTFYEAFNEGTNVDPPIAFRRATNDLAQTQIPPHVFPDNTSSAPPVKESSDFGFSSSLPAHGIDSTGTAGAASSSSSSSRTQVLNHVVNQLFAGVNIADITMVGSNSHIPVSMIRKILARQLTMAVQLLLQILLHADPRSECFDLGYKSLLELSNLRNQAMKKAALLHASLANNMLPIRKNYNMEKGGGSGNINSQAIVQLVQDVQDRAHLPSQSSSSSTIPPFSQLSRSIGMYKSPSLSVATSSVSSSSSSSSSAANVASNNYDTSLLVPSRRLTRSSILQDTRSSYSILDLPILSRMNECMITLDQTKQFIYHQLHALESSLALASAQQYPSHPHHHLSSSQSWSMEWQKKQYLFQLCNFNITSLCQQMKLPCWQSLLPTPSYPFAEADLSQYLLTIPPSSMQARMYFTPAEEDLLLRGIIYTTQGLSLSSSSTSSSSSSGSSVTNNSHMLSSNQKSKSTITALGASVSTTSAVSVSASASSAATSATLLPVIPWKEIQEQYLPSKDIPSLQYYYEQKTQLPTSMASTTSSSDAPNGAPPIPSIPYSYSRNPFRKYQQYCLEQRKYRVHSKARDDRWLLEEDLLLLNGYCHFGEKSWFCISVYFLPHRKPSELKSRWSMIQRIWQQTFSSGPKTASYDSTNPEGMVSEPASGTATTASNGAVLSDTTLTPHVKAFLMDLVQCKTIRDVKTMIAQGGGQEMKALEHISPPVMSSTIGNPSSSSITSLSSPSSSSSTTAAVALHQTTERTLQNNQQIEEWILAHPSEELLSHSFHAWGDPQPLSHASHAHPTFSTASVPTAPITLPSSTSIPFPTSSSPQALPSVMMQSATYRGEGVEAERLEDSDGKEDGLTTGNNYLVNSRLGPRMVPANPIHYPRNISAHSFQNDSIANSVFPSSSSSSQSVPSNIYYHQVGSSNTASQPPPFSSLLANSSFPPSGPANSHTTVQSRAINSDSSSWERAVVGPPHWNSNSSSEVTTSNQRKKRTIPTDQVSFNQAHTIKKKSAHTEHNVHVHDANLNSTPGLSQPVQPALLCADDDSTLHRVTANELHQSVDDALAPPETDAMLIMELSNFSRM